MRNWIIDSRLLLARRYGIVIPEPQFLRENWIQKLARMIRGKRKIFAKKHD